MPIKNYSVRLSTITMFFERTSSVNDEYIRILDKEYTEEEWDEFGEIEHDKSVDALLDYQAIVTRSVLGELNALVEYELKWVAKSIQRKEHGTSFKAESKLDLNKAKKIIQDEFHIELKDLPGFAEVDEIRRVLNAYKHDDGYSGKYEPFFTSSKEKKYELDPGKAKIYIQAVGEFLHALPGDKLNLGSDVRVKR